jgi:PHD/YefM family antitoxin component YafN of YafNO toxin-antitoxin module
MSTPELRLKLIERIQKTDNNEILEEVYRLLQLETDDDEVYQLSPEQQSAVAEAREQIQTGKFLTENQADKDIEEWLGK